MDAYVGESHCDCTYKVILIGDSGVGKSSYFIRLIKNEFQQYPRHTLGIDAFVKIGSVDQKRVKVNIYDTAGHERFRSITRQ
jgi:small GTP-binding protein